MYLKLQGALAIFLLLISTVISTAQPRETPSVTFHRVGENLYEIRGGAGANSGVFIGESEVVLIDVKMDKDSVDNILAWIVSVTDKPVRYLINTHSDGDHISGNRFLNPSVTVIAHENCRQEFFHPGRNNDPSKWNDPTLVPFLPSITFKNKMTLHLGSTVIELWNFGVGHTTGDTVVYFPKMKTAFIGDQIFLTRPQLIHTYKGGNSFGHVTNLTRMLDTIDAERFCSGHSDIASREDILQHIDRMRERQSKVRALVKAEKSTEEILRTFPENENRLITSIYTEISTGTETETAK
ncbi:MAG: MBL fold metallo-hydrolase [Candidatus Latescibacteria bacterium]|jgi:cyclase|nr:MBL fold metallo-hydrolase [Candidatus Latescibacterota bacterium]